MTINVICTSPLLMHNKRIDRGEVLRLSALDAAHAVGSGRARLADPADQAALDDAIRRERDGVLLEVDPGEMRRMRFAMPRRVA